MNISQRTARLILAILVTSAGLWCAAAETQTSSNNLGQDYSLGIFGNANMDDKINEMDAVYVEGIIKGTNSQTNLSDANFDGSVDEKDLAQIKSIIGGKEEKLTVMDGNGKPVTVKKPVNRIIVEYKDTAELMRILDSEDKVVGVSSYIKQWNEAEAPELSKLPGVGLPWKLDYEAVLKLNPDILLTFGASTDEKSKQLPGVDVLFLGLYTPDLSNPAGDIYVDGIRKLGYILDKEDRAEEFINWRLNWINELKSRTQNLSDKEKPRIFNYAKGQGTGLYSTYTNGYKVSKMSDIAGGKNIADDLPAYIQAVKYTTELDPEWILEQNPEVIVAHVVLEDTAHGYAVDDPSEMAALRDEILNRSELASVDAIKNRRVYIMGDNFRNDATGCFMGVGYMGKWFHPDLFKDIDPQAIHQEYLDRFHKSLNYNLQEHGVFTYPLPE